MRERRPYHQSHPSEKGDRILHPDERCMYYREGACLTRPDCDGKDEGCHSFFVMRVRYGAWGAKRKTPYTQSGIKRLSCIRCGKPASYQWNICADKNNFRPLCEDCDVDLNRMVLEWMGHPDMEGTIKAYIERAKQ